MKKIFLFVVFLCLFSVGTVGAVSLTLETASTMVEPSNNFDVALVVSGLGNLGPDSVGDFDIDILYDQGTMAFVGYELGNLLGDVLAGEAIDWSWGDLGGSIDVAETSLLSDSELDALQPSSFTLATLTFHYLGPDPSTISIDDSDPDWTYKVGNAFAAPLLVEVGDSLTIKPVPEPTTILLLCIGLTGLVGFRKRFKKT